MYLTEIEALKKILIITLLIAFRRFIIKLAVNIVLKLNTLKQNSK